MLQNLEKKRPKLKENVKSLVEDVKRIVDQINKLTKKEQEEELKKIDGSLLVKRKEERKALKDLENAKVGKFVARLPPGPEKYPHLGHAIAYMINYLYVQKYKGKLWLRFEDTNPKTVKKEFYKAIKEDIKNIGIRV